MITATHSIATATPELMCLALKLAPVPADGYFSLFDQLFVPSMERFGSSASQVKSSCSGRRAPHTSRQERSTYLTALNLRANLVQRFI
jgi:hypothetical protein